MRFKLGMTSLCIALLFSACRKDSGGSHTLLVKDVIIDNNGCQINYTYDSINRLVSVTQCDTVETYTYSLNTVTYTKVTTGLLLYKNVYNHPNNLDKVIKVHKGDDPRETPELLKAQYYLAKILHILLPDNMPNAHAVYTPDPERNVNNTVLVVEKKYPDEDHHTLSNILRTKTENNNPGSLNRQDYTVYNTLKDQMFNNSEVKRLYTKLVEIFDEDTIDNNGPNFALDKNGNATYLDDIMPWDDEFDGYGRMCRSRKNFDIKILRQKIDAIQNESDRKFALTCLDRILFLHKEQKRIY